MGPVSILYVAFAGISLFACIMQLFYAYRKTGELVWLAGSILSVTIFIYFTAWVICLTPFGVQCPPYKFLKYQLIFNQLVAIVQLGVLNHLLKNQKQFKSLISLVILGTLMFISLSLPDHVLFGAGASVTQHTLPLGDLVLVPGKGFTLWRALKDISILLFVIFSFLILMSKLNEVSFSTVATLFAGLGIILLAAVHDQLIDLGYFRSFYIQPFALFAYYLVLSFTPMVIFLDESNRRKLLLSQEKKMQDMVFQVDLIVVSLNRMGIIEQVNPFFCKLTGYNEEEVIGKDWFEFLIPPKEYYNVQGAFVEILEYEFHPQFLNPVLTKNKEEIMIRWFNVRTLSQEGKITGSLSIGVDINDDYKEKADLINRVKVAEDLVKRMKDKEKGTN